MIMIKRTPKEKNIGKNLQNLVFEFGDMIANEITDIPKTVYLAKEPKFLYAFKDYFIQSVTSFRMYFVFPSPYASFAMA